jgi:hypothetical protein
MFSLQLRKQKLKLPVTLIRRKRSSVSYNYGTRRFCRNFRSNKEKNLKKLKVWEAGNDKILIGGNQNGKE